jgi:hypothetical protein
MIPQNWKVIQVFTAEYSSKMYAKRYACSIGTNIANLNEDTNGRGIARLSLKSFIPYHAMPCLGE